jgi:hypothetical protein
MGSSRNRRQTLAPQAPFLAVESEIAPKMIGTDCFSDAAELLSQLEKSRMEYDKLKEEKMRLEQTKRDQQLETTIEMRETI